MNTLMKRNNGNGDFPATSFTGMVDRIFQDNLSRFFDDGLWGTGKTARSLNVPVNLKETATAYELEVVAPGLKKEDFNVNLSGDVLTVSFEQKQESTQKNKEEGWIHNEYQRRSFSRSFRLDDTADINQISAKYADGILHLQIPKKEEAKKPAKAIEVK